MMMTVEVRVVGVQDYPPRASHRVLGDYYSVLSQLCPATIEMESTEYTVIHEKLILCLPTATRRC